MKLWHIEKLIATLGRARDERKGDSNKAPKQVVATPVKSMAIADQRVGRRSTRSQRDASKSSPTNVMANQVHPTAPNPIAGRQLMTLGSGATTATAQNITLGRFRMATSEM